MFTAEIQFTKGGEIKHTATEGPTCKRAVELALFSIRQSGGAPDQFCEVVLYRHNGGVRESRRACYDAELLDEGTPDELMMIHRLYFDSEPFTPSC
jgi:hypothetical protein